MNHCSGCKNPFNSEPYVKRTPQQGGEKFCKRDCYEVWLHKNFPEFYPQPQLATHHGNHIKRRH